MANEMFLTGATGFIGRCLLKKWLDSSDVTLNLLVRSKHDENPKNRIKKRLTQLYHGSDISKFAGRINVIEGDLALDKLGLNEAEYADLANRVIHIIHCGAAARFDLELEEARKINVKGTENILDFARQCKNLEKINYIGTAYVAGKRKEIIKEDELDKGQEHSNTYEQSKFEAEKLIREHMKDFPIAILRPSIVICDSKTGWASNHNGFVRALKMYWLGHAKIFPGYPSSIMDLVPVDYVSDAAYAISNNRENIGKCFHLTAGPDNNTTLEEVRDLASHYLHKEKFKIIPPEEFNEYASRSASILTEEKQKMINEIKLYMPYLTSGLQFDNTNTVRETGLISPKVSSYFEKMAEYLMKSGP